MWSCTRHYIFRMNMKLPVLLLLVYLQGVSAYSSELIRCDEQSDKDGCRDVCEGNTDDSEESKKFACNRLCVDLSPDEFVSECRTACDLGDSASCRKVRENDCAHDMGEISNEQISAACDQVCLLDTDSSTRETACAKGCDLDTILGITQIPSCLIACEAYGDDDSCEEYTRITGSCTGEETMDECGVCGGSGIAEGKCDCAGNVEDECGVCGGSGIAEGKCDCAGNVLGTDGNCQNLGTWTFAQLQQVYQYLTKCGEAPADPPAIYTNWQGAKPTSSQIEAEYNVNRACEDSVE